MHFVDKEFMGNYYFWHFYVFQAVVLHRQRLYEMKPLINQTDMPDPETTKLS